MNALKLFKLVVFPHLWLTLNIWPAVIGAAGSVIGGALASQGGSDTSTQQVDQPDYIQHPYRQYAEKLIWRPGEDNNSANFWGQYRPTMFQGPQEARMPNWLKQDYRQYANSPDDPNSGFSQARDYMSSVAAGDYLGLNPAMQQAVMNPALDQVASRFNAAGRSGYNPANIQSQNSAAMSALMPFHNAALDRQYNAATAMPGFDAEAMGRSQMWGEAKMGEKQKRINTQLYKHDWDAKNYLDRVTQFKNLLPGAQNAGTRSSTSGYNPSWMDIAQGALGGASLASSAYNNWMGTQQQQPTPWAGSYSPGAPNGTQAGSPGTMWNNGMMVQFPTSI